MATNPLHRTLFAIAILLCIHSSYSQNVYEPDAGLRTNLRKATWQELKSKTPKKQLFLTSLVFNSNQCFDLFEKAAKQRNWPSYTPATIMAFREVVIKEAIEGRDYTEEEIKAIYSTQKNKFTAENVNNNLDREALQRKYDPLILEALWIATLREFIKDKNDDARNLAQQLWEKPLFQLEVDKKETVVKKQPETVTKRNPVENTPMGSSSSTTTPEVSEIILRTVTNYGLNGAYIDNEVSVLFSNGELLTNPSEPLEELNVAASKRKYPKKWATWKKQGNVLYVTKAWKNKTYDWKKWFKLRPGKKGMKLVGTFNTFDAFGGDRVINASIVAFDGQGRFAWKTIKGGDTPWLPEYSKSNSSGTYLIDNYTITLKYNNGATESFFFGLYPKDNEHFVIGLGHFVPK